MIDSAVLHLPTLLFAAAGMVTIVAAVATAALVGETALRGRGWWLGAQWSAATGLWALAGGVSMPPWAGLGACLLLAWPLALLVGLRHFNSRQPPRARVGIDAGVFVLALLMLLASDSAVLPGAAWIAGLTLVHAYAAATLVGTAGWRESTSLRILATGIAAVAGIDAIAFATAVVAGGASDAAAAVAASVAALAALGSSFALLGLAHERTVGALRESRRRLRYLANIDMLTQVPNRRHFGELARRALQRDAERRATVLMFDIDHFKRINDDLGHAAGDRALRLVARCVQETLRADDVAGRHGGDEFVLLLPRTGLRDAMAVATRIVQRAQHIAEQEAVPQLSLSFGVVAIGVDESLDEAMRRADRALYEAKRQGRGRAVSAAGDENQPVFVESRRLGLV